MRSKLSSARRLVLGAALVGSLVVLPGPAASAHVHGVTPLLELQLECEVVPANAGASQTDTTPAAAPDGPISVGLIPPLEVGDGGSDAPVQCP